MKLRNSRYIPALDGHKTPQLVILYLRESDKSQANNLHAQKVILKANVEKRGYCIVGIVKEIAPGWKKGRRGLRRAIRLAKRYGAIVVAEALNRFVRRRQRPDKSIPPLRRRDIKWLLREAGAVRLATSIHPDTPEKEVGRLQKIRGQAGSGHYGGRPKKKPDMKARRRRFAPLAWAMQKVGFPLREIGRQLNNVPHNTVSAWIRWEENRHGLSAMDKP